MTNHSFAAACVSASRHTIFNYHVSEIKLYITYSIMRTANILMSAPSCLKGGGHHPWHAGSRFPSSLKLSIFIYTHSTLSSHCNACLSQCYYFQASYDNVKVAERLRPEVMAELAAINRAELATHAAAAVSGAPTILATDEAGNAAAAAAADVEMGHLPPAPRQQAPQPPPPPLNPVRPLGPDEGALLGAQLVPSASTSDVKGGPEDGDMRVRQLCHCLIRFLINERQGLPMCLEDQSDGGSSSAWPPPSIEQVPGVGSPSAWAPSSIQHVLGVGSSSVWASNPIIGSSSGCSFFVGGEAESAGRQHSNGEVSAPQRTGGRFSVPGSVAHWLAGIDPRDADIAGEVMRCCFSTGGGAAPFQYETLQGRDIGAAPSRHWPMQASLPGDGNSSSRSRASRFISAAGTDGTSSARGEH